MKNQFLIMEKLKDSLKGLDEATKNAEADRAALIMRIDELETDLLNLNARLMVLEKAFDRFDL